MDDMRALWIRIETVHAVTYFAEEPRTAAVDCGLRGFWMGYFGFRAAPLGPVGPEVVDELFYNFAPDMVRRSIPDAWSFAAPETLLPARASSAAAALARVGADDLARATSALPTLAIAAQAADPTGRRLYAANRALTLPDDRVEALWQTLTTLREQRGDSHVNALRDAGVSGCQAHLLLAADQGLPGEVLRESRGWTAEHWERERTQLVDAGLIDGGGSVTVHGRELRAAVEAATDAAALEPWATIGDRTDEVLAALDPLARTIAGSATIRYPNPMGLPTPD